MNQGRRVLRPSRLSRWQAGEMFAVQSLRIWRENDGGDGLRAVATGSVEDAEAPYMLA